MEKAESNLTKQEFEYSKVAGKRQKAEKELDELKEEKEDRMKEEVCQDEVLKNLRVSESEGGKIRLLSGCGRKEMNLPWISPA